MADVRFPKVETEYFTPAGGLDQVTPRLLLKPGRAIDASNFECDIDGGYRRISGYERFTTAPLASSMTYYTIMLDFYPGYGIGTLGTFIVGATSGAKAVYVNRVNNPNIFGTGGSGELLYVANVKGKFLLNETFFFAEDGGTPRGTITQVPVAVTGATAAAHAQAIEEARNAWRMTISPVGGFGPDPRNVLAMGAVLGTFELNDKIYAFRRRKESNTVGMYVAWDVSMAPAYPNLPYWNRASPDYGTLPAINPDLIRPGSFEVACWRFSGAGRKRAYIVTGVSKLLEYDDTPGVQTITEIATGMTQDTPNHLCIHRNRMWLAFGTSLQYSAGGDPTTWSVVLGAGEIAAGDEITGMISVMSDPSSPAMLVFTKASTFILYGDPDDTGNPLRLVLYDPERGALPGTAQVIDQPIFAGDEGVTRLTASQSYGSFEGATITHIVKRWIEKRRGMAIGSMVVRSKNQYRVFFSDRSALYITFRDGKVIGVMPVYLDIQPFCFWVSKLDNGEELALIGAEDGYLYKLDSGNSFDGRPIPFMVWMAFNHSKSPRIRKQYKRVVLELSGDGYAEFEYGYDLSYAGPDADKTPEREIEDALAPSAGRWDEGVWDFSYWDGTQIAPLVIDSPGSGTNIAIRVQGRSALTEAFTVNGVITHFIPRRLER